MNASPRIFWNLIGHPGDYVTDFVSTHPGTQPSSHSHRLALHEQKWKSDKKKKKVKTSCLGYLASKAEFQALVTGPFSLQIVERTRKNRAWLL